MEDLKIRLIKNKKELKQILEIRRIVFIKGQNVPEKRERDGLDKTAKHIIVLYKNKPIGCARVKFYDKRGKLERIALLEKYRDKNFGRLIMDYLINYCKKHKVKEIVLHSQYYVKGFYEKCGFKPRGKIFLDANIKHIEMCHK